MMKEFADPLTIAALIVSLGIGGAVGALANAALAGRRVRDAFLRFEAAFRTYFADKSDDGATELRELFEELRGTLKAAESAIEAVQRALKPRKK